MKKIIIFAVIGIVFFGLLVGGAFFVLSYLEKDASEEVIEEGIPIQETNSVAALLLISKNNLIDSLMNAINNKDSVLYNNVFNIDSLKNITKVQAAQINADSITISKLNKSVNELSANSINIKSLAKTYEQMKPKDMKPIFAKLDTKTIIALYNNMSSRKQPNLLKALSNEKAAEITKKMTR